MSADDPPSGERRPPRKRARETVNEADIMRSTREVAARKGISPDDIMMSSRERGVAPPPTDGVPRGRRMPMRRGMRGGDAPPPPVATAPMRPLHEAPIDEPPTVWSPPTAVSTPVSGPSIAWADIQKLAAGYDALQIAGSLDRAIALADRVRAEFTMHGGFSVSPRELAACIAFETRTCLHCGVVPDGDDLRYLSALYMVVFSHKP